MIFVSLEDTFNKEKDLIGSFSGQCASAQPREGSLTADARNNFPIVIIMLSCDCRLNTQFMWRPGPRTLQTASATHGLMTHIEVAHGGIVTPTFYHDSLGTLGKNTPSQKHLYFLKDQFSFSF